MHSECDLTILGWHDVSQVLNGHETDLMNVVKAAYLAHEAGRSSLPQSIFLRFPSRGSDRIIALPAYLNCGEEMTGVKWVASFPGNLARGLDRASAVIILNCNETGRARTVLEASAINAKRTAASAAVAAEVIHSAPDESVLGLIGCGLINFEMAKFLSVVFPNISKLLLCDTVQARAQAFGERAVHSSLASEFEIVSTPDGVLAFARLISIATTASKPHINDLRTCKPGTTICHVSLRDIAPQSIIAADNTTDDIAHVCRENTSLHLAEQTTGDRSFIRGTLGGILSGQIAPRRSDDGVAIFSPFGLGILDIATAHWVVKEAASQQIGVNVGAFLPNGNSWL